jgi:hypothetical protein
MNNKIIVDKLILETKLNNITWHSFCVKPEFGESLCCKYKNDDIVIFKLITVFGHRYKIKINDIDFGKNNKLKKIFNYYNNEIMKKRNKEITNIVKKYNITGMQHVNIANYDIKKIESEAYNNEINNK